MAVAFRNRPDGWRGGGCAVGGIRLAVHDAVLRIATLRADAARADHGARNRHDPADVDALQPRRTVDRSCADLAQSLADDRRGAAVGCCDRRRRTRLASGVFFPGRLDTVAGAYRDDQRPDQWRTLRTGLAQRCQSGWRRVPGTHAVA